MRPSRKPNRSRDRDATRVSVQHHAPNARGHLATCLPHSETTRGPPGGRTCPIPAIPKAGGTLHHIGTHHRALRDVWTAPTGAHPVPTAPPHSGVLRHLPTHHLPPQYTHFAPKYPPQPHDTT